MGPGAALAILLLIAFAPFILWILMEARRQFIEAEREKQHPTPKK